MWLIPVVVISTSSCVKPASVVGSWHGTLFNQDVTTAFNEDKTLTINSKSDQMGATFSGTYTVSPKILTITVSDYKLKNVPDSLVPLAAKLFDPLKGTTKKLNYQFNSADELAITFQGKTDVLKRDPQQ
jgi:hypothetical protein